MPRLSAEWSLYSAEPWREVEGTLCYIDISGFTALSEKLARRGRIGAEELTEVLNYVFAKMMTVAYDRGGSLLKFGGDALLLLFAGSGHPVQAASAAVEMQAVLREAREYETSAGHLALKMSVGLHSGTVHLFHVGESHKELILTGPAASMTTEMEETAVAGEILISSATKEALPDGGADSAKDEGWLLNWRKARIECCGWTPRAEISADAVSEGMPLALRDYLEHGAAEPEHHIATVGFIKYEGVDALMEEGGPPAVAAALDELVRNVQEAVDEEGVTFLASDIDQDGGKIIIVAGVPGVQEDDEGRVLRAARRISGNAGTLSLRIGVNQGHVFVGEIGTDFRATYTIMGDTVNLAARLMAAASPGEVYASPTALDRSLTLFETAPLEPFHVKGKEEPVQAYAVGEVTGRRPSRRGGALSFVGREQELRKLHSMIEELFSGIGNAVAITGERGVGKSRLVDEILPSLKRAVHISIRAEPYGIGTPYRPLRDPVRRLLGVVRDEPQAMADALQQAIDKLLPQRAPLAPLVADVAMIEMASTPEVDQIEPKFRQDRTADVLMELFSVVCRGPVFFEVEDGHYMDEASSHVMQRISKATGEQPWLVLTTRQRDAGGFDPGIDEIQIGPLSDEESRELIVDATAAAPLRPHDVEAIVQRGGGLPLFLEEIVNAVRTAGDLESLPDSLDAVVSSQIDALPPLARRLLRFSSVLGRSFRVSILNELLEQEGIRVDSATLGELSGFLVPEDGNRFRFRHAMIRDVAYDGLSFRRRKELHLRAAKVVEDTSEDPDSAADLLALHYSIGGDAERAWHYSRVAGDQARDAYANVEAAAHYARAIESARRLTEISDSERFEVWAGLGEVREQAGLFDSALDAYQKAIHLADGDSIREAEVMLKRARTRERAGQYSVALRTTTEVKKKLQEDGSVAGARLKSKATSYAAFVRQRQEKPSEALAQGLLAADDARESGDTAALARAYTVISWAYLMLDEPGAEGLLKKALSLYEELEDHIGQADVTNNLGGLAYYESRWDDALEFYERSRSESERVGNVGDVGFEEMNIGELLVNQGRLDEAEEVLRRASRVLRSIGYTYGAVFAEIQLGRCLTAKGKLDEAEELLSQIRAEVVKDRMTAMDPESAIYLAECLVAGGQPAEALAIMDEVSADLGGEAAVYAATELRIRGAALLAMGRHEDAAEHVQRGIGEARERGLEYDLALLLELEAQLDLPESIAGREEALDEARAIFARLGVVAERRPDQLLTNPA